MTTSYYLGGTLVAQREGTTLRYAYQDHLSGTSLMTDTNGNSLGTMKYYPYGSTRSGSVPTDELFTGQKLDGTGLYYYGARYYDPVTGRFISPDTVVPDPVSSQGWNRYSYCINNPLKYNDPSGHVINIADKVQFSYADGNRIQTASSSPVTPEESCLIAAWNLFQDTCPDLARMLEESDEVINIRSAMMGDNLGGSTQGFDIKINTKRIVEGVDYTAYLLSHEVVHETLEMIGLGTSESIFEEIVAFQFMNWFAGEIGYDEDLLFFNETDDVITFFPYNNPILGDQVATVKKDWQEQGYYSEYTIGIPSINHYDAMYYFFIDPYWNGVPFSY